MSCHRAPNRRSLFALFAGTCLLLASDVVAPVRAGTARPEAVPVATRIRNVKLHIGQGVELHVDDLRGRMLSRVSGQPPVFDDLDSYLLDIDAARVSMTAESLTNLMNHYIFAYPGALLSHLKIGIENGGLTQSGTLRKGIGTDLLLIDANPKGPFDFSPQRYNDQLVAGYSKNTPAHGLIVYMPTLNDLANVGTSGGLTPAATGR